MKTFFHCLEKKNFIEDFLKHDSPPTSKNVCEKSKFNLLRGNKKYYLYLDFPFSFGAKIYLFLLIPKVCFYNEWRKKIHLCISTCTLIYGQFYVNLYGKCEDAWVLFVHLGRATASPRKLFYFSLIFNATNVVDRHTSTYIRN